MWLTSCVNFRVLHSRYRSANEITNLRGRQNTLLNKRYVAINAALQIDVGTPILTRLHKVDDPACNFSALLALTCCRVRSCNTTKWQGSCTVPAWPRPLICLMGAADFDHKNLRYYCSTCPYIYDVDRSVSSACMSRSLVVSGDVRPFAPVFCRVQIEKATNSKFKEVDDVLGGADGWKSAEKTFRTFQTLEGPAGCSVCKAACSANGT